MNGNVLDIFKSDAFSVVALTDAINKLPFIPGQAGRSVAWNENGVPTLSIMLEERNGVLTLVNPSARGGPGSTLAKNRRTARTLSIPHYELNDAVYADEVQGVRAFGQESQVATLQDVISQRQAQLVQLTLDPTLEYQRVGALKGIILNADGSTLYNLFTEFGVNAPSDVSFALSTSANGALRTICSQTIRTITTTLDGVPFDGVYSFCGADFYDALIANPEVRATFLNNPAAAALREKSVYGEFEFGGITFAEYRGSVGGTAFIAHDECRLFPVGVPALFRTVYAPADYIETVNTIGLPRYSKQYPMENDKGINLDVQMNALSYCTRPNVLVRGTQA